MYYCNKKDCNLTYNEYLFVIHQNFYNVATLKLILELCSFMLALMVMQQIYDLSILVNRIWFILGYNSLVELKKIFTLVLRRIIKNEYLFLIHQNYYNVATLQTYTWTLFVSVGTYGNATNIWFIHYMWVLSYQLKTHSICVILHELKYREPKYQ